ncbi:hypothetical protein LXL04_026555 [Taraxacum kok-saghyz]
MRYKVLGITSVYLFDLIEVRRELGERSNGKSRIMSPELEQILKETWVLKIDKKKKERSMSDSGRSKEEFTNDEQREESAEGKCPKKALFTSNSCHYLCPKKALFTSNSCHYLCPKKALFTSNSCT